MPTAFPIGLLLLTAVTACVLVWAIWTDWKDLENWLDFSDKGTDELWLPIRNLTDDLMWAESTPLDFTPTRFVETYTGLKKASDDLVYISLKAEVLFLYTARMILFLKQEQDAKESAWSPTVHTASTPAMMPEFVRRVRFLSTSTEKPSKEFCKEQYRTPVPISFPKWPEESPIGSIRTAGGKR